MGNDTKWADVAHYYTKSQIDLQIKNRDHAERFLMVSFRNVGGSHFEEWVNDGVYWRAYGSQFSAWDDHKPILLHRDDMTMVQAIALYKHVHGDDGGAYSGKNCLSWAKSHFDTGKYEPRVLRWFYANGFDMDGLIESGQAIRKEMGNG